MDLESKSDKSKSEFLSNVIAIHSINNSVLSCGYYHILFYSKCHYHIMNSQFLKFFVISVLSFVFLTNWLSKFQGSNSHIKNSQFLNFSYLGILEFSMNMRFSQNGFSPNNIPSFRIPSFVGPRKTFPVLSFSVSCVNPFLLLYLQQAPCI